MVFPSATKSIYSGNNDVHFSSISFWRLSALWESIFAQHTEDGKYWQGTKRAEPICCTSSQPPLASVDTLINCGTHPKHLSMLPPLQRHKYQNAIDSKKTRRERLKSALYLRLKKRKTFFRKKLEIFEFFFFQKMSQFRKKSKRGPFGLYQHIFCCKISKYSNGGLF